MREELVAAGVAAGQRARRPRRSCCGLDPRAAPSGRRACCSWAGSPRRRACATRSRRGGCSGVELPLVLAGTGPLRERARQGGGAGRHPALQAARAGWTGDGSPASTAAPARCSCPRAGRSRSASSASKPSSFGVPVVAWESGGIARVAPGPGARVAGATCPRWRGRCARQSARRVTLPPRFERDEALGRLLALYARLARRSGKSAGAA